MISLQKIRELMKSQTHASGRARRLVSLRAARAVARGNDLSVGMRRGLTLVELAIVILVLGIIMTIVIASLDFGIVDDAKKMQVQYASKTLEISLRRYEMDNPALEDGTRLGILAQRNPNNPTWRPVDDKLVLDPWAQEYFICQDDLGQKQICSYGADRAPGGTGENQDFFLTDKSSWPTWLSGKSDQQQ
jgi:general secretion pathway protein G